MTANRKKFYITTAIPYVNAAPHIGHALEFIQADVLARYRRIKGDDVLLLSGSDDNALKNVQAAEEAGHPIQEFIASNAELFGDLAQRLNVHFDLFQKGSDQHHHFPSSQKLWGLCAEAGDIYKKSYRGLYCLGCEAFYNPEELNAAGECFEHPGKKLEVVAEENYFFRLSRYQDKLRELIHSETIAIIPAGRKNEVLSFLDQPLRDISISRSNDRARNWGVPVPGDPSQRIYVWFDALNIYQSGVGFGWDEQQYRKWWPADVHLIGKGILRFHAVYWPAFLLSAGLDLPKAIFVHGYVTVEGQKISKTLGNVVNPFLLAAKYGADTLRYYLLREVPSTGDGDFSESKLVERYNGELADGLGNFVSRVAALGESVSPIRFDFPGDLLANVREASELAFQNYERAFADFRLNEALAEVWRLIAFGDRYLNSTAPWKVTDRAELQKIIANAGYLVSTVANLLRPFLPETADRIGRQVAISQGVLIEIKRGAVLFPRLEKPLSSFS